QVLGDGRSGCDTGAGEGGVLTLQANEILVTSAGKIVGDGIVSTNPALATGAGGAADPNYFTDSQNPASGQPRGLQLPAGAGFAKDIGVNPLTGHGGAGGGANLGTINCS